METVFDFNPTQEELKTLFGSLETAEEVREQHRSAPNESAPDPTVVYLLIERKQWKKAREYAQNFDDETRLGCLLPDIGKAEESDETGETLV